MAGNKKTNSDGGRGDDHRHHTSGGCWKDNSRQNIPTRDDIADQGREVLKEYLQSQLASVGMTEPIIYRSSHLNGAEGGAASHVCDRKILEIARVLKNIGDELESNTMLQRKINELDPCSPRQTVINVARAIFADGIFNWGRVATLFYFAAKMAIKALERGVQTLLDIISDLIDWIVEVIRDYVADWIIQRGGWDYIFEHYGPSTNQFVGVVMFAVVAVGLILVLKR